MKPTASQQCLFDLRDHAKFVISEEASAFYHSITVTLSHSAKEKGETVKDVELKRATSKCCQLRAID